MLPKLLPLSALSLLLSASLSSCARVAPVELPRDKESAQRLIVGTTSPGTTFGNPDAPTKIVVFHDTNCGMCRKMWREVVNGSLKKPIEEGKVAYRFIEFPLGLAPNSSTISVAAKCAAEQQRYRQFMDVVYTTKGEHGRAELTEFAKKAGLDIGKVNECISSGRGKAAAKFDVALGTALGVVGTPSFYVNGEELKGNWTQPGAWDAVTKSNSGTK